MVHLINMFMKKFNRQKGFTIVELLIVIVVIGILAAITVVAYNGIQERARTVERENDIALYHKAVLAARINSGQVLRYITGSGWSMGLCSTSYGNPDNIEPKNLPKTHACWTQYYDNLTKIGNAAGMNLDGLRSGDPNGNPYMFDENEGENCGMDAMFVFTGDGTASNSVVKRIARTAECPPATP